MVLSSLAGLFPSEQLVLIFSVLGETLLPDTQKYILRLHYHFLGVFFFFFNFAMLIKTARLLSTVILKAVPHSLCVPALST